MSVSFSFARLSVNVQHDFYNNGNLRKYLTVSLGMSGYKGGSNCRVKTFPTTYRCQAYINKLLIGGWITEQEYDKAFTALDGLHYVTVQTANDRKSYPSSCYLEQSPGDTAYHLSLFDEEIRDPWENVTFGFVDINEASS